jgi:hypothetical protein
MVEVETRFRWHEAGGPDDGYSIEARLNEAAGAADAAALVGSGGS